MIRINEELCCYCGSCVAVCPQNIIELVDTYVKFFHEKCTLCARCVKGCPIGALRITNYELQIANSTFNRNL